MSRSAITLIHDEQALPVAVLAATELLKPRGLRIRTEAKSAQSNPAITVEETKQVGVGSVLVLRYLARRASSLGVELYGSTAEQAMEVDFFLTLAALLVNKDTLQTYATQIDKHLADRTFLVADRLSIADLYVWEQFTANPRWAHFTKTSGASFPSLFRWYGLISNQPCMKPVMAAKQALLKAKAEKALARSSEGAGFDVELPGAEMGKVVTRFPPEPSGYLHIGHAKAALLNDAIAKKFNGQLVLRFDDTNPQKEKEEYVENIMNDLKTLGVVHHRLTHTSDYFQLIQDEATNMLKKGKAYIDNTPVEEMRRMRAEGIESPCRSQGLEENLRLWEEMKAGTPEGLKCCMRAKIDMQAPNKAMRDPTLYRCNVGAPHHRTGTKFKVYPTYDFACPIVDSIEGVTHTLRTNEYRDRNAQYYWMIDAIGLKHKPYIRDYSRLNFVYTVLSKRKLQWFVESKLVDGWYDPRFPTIQGMVRRGLTVEALREFILGQGFSMSTNMMEWDKIWTINKRHIDPVAPRYTGITLQNQAIIELDNFNAQQPEVVSVALHPKNPSVGKKAISRSSRVIIEQDDARLIKEGEEVTLMNWGNVIIKKIHKAADGLTVTRLEGSLHLEGDPKKTDKKLTWLDGSAHAAADLIPISFIELDTLVTVPKVEEGVAFESVVNPVTKHETVAVGEAAMRSLSKGSIIQIARRGFFIVDALGDFAPNNNGAQRMQLIFIPDGRTKAMSTLSTKVDKGKGISSGKHQH